MSNAIPVVDCAGGVAEHDEQIMQALRTVGFVYLTNCGVDFGQVERVQKLMLDFWQQPAATKLRYVRGSHAAFDENSGYVPPNMEILDPDNNNNEIREAFNVHRAVDKENPYMFDAVVPGVAEAIGQLYTACSQLNDQLLRLLQKHIQFKSSEFLTASHRQLGGADNATTLRLLHYPPLPDHIAPGTQRCGEHSDYGTLTLLFQDQVGGLEVRGRDGSFVPAAPVPRAVLLNLGDALQRWTSDQLLAVAHRVLVPADKSKWKDTRQSLAFFVHPDDQVPLNNQVSDGDDQKYDDITAKQYLLDKFSKTY